MSFASHKHNKASNLKTFYAKYMNTTLLIAFVGLLYLLTYY